jgi:predicted RNA binding protein YcfA (HicA-like mRNA interferase family)
MGKLSGFRYRDLVIKLRKAGFVFDRQARGSHEIWWNPATRARTTLVNHPGTIPEGTVRAIIRQAGLSIEDFLRL